MITFMGNIVWTSLKKQQFNTIVAVRQRLTSPFFQSDWRLDLGIWSFIVIDKLQWGDAHALSHCVNVLHAFLGPISSCGLFCLAVCQNQSALTIPSSLGTNVPLGYPCVCVAPLRPLFTGGFLECACVVSLVLTLTSVNHVNS